MAVVALPEVFTSCGDDDKDDEPEGVQTAIVGTWNASDAEDGETVFITYTFRSNGMFSARYWSESESFEEDDTLTFNGNYTYLPTSNTLSIEGASTNGSQQLKIKVDCRIAGSTMTWTFTDGSKVVFKK